MSSAPSGTPEGTDRATAPVQHPRREAAAPAGTAPASSRGVVARLTGALRSTPVRASFLVLAVGLAVLAVWSEREPVAAALVRIEPQHVLAALALSVANVLLALLSWRAVMADLGSPLPWRHAAKVFLVGQVGKYVPGGVWNLVAAAELARDHGVPRRRTVSAMLVQVSLAIATAVLLGLALLPLMAGELADRLRWAGLLIPLVLVGMHPAVLNRALAVVLRLTRRDPLEHPVTLRGVVVASAWALASWVAVGLQVWLLLRPLGASPGAGTLALAVGGYALAWVVGFLVVVAPAGVGPREIALAVVLSPVAGRGEVLVAVLLSRVLLTVADLGLAAGALTGVRDRRPRI